MIVSTEKKKVRAAFRDAVFGRDKYKCKICNWDKCKGQLDAHHITNRNDMPGGGYVKENGITLCPGCHIDAELGKINANELYKIIKSSYDMAVSASNKIT